MVFDATQWMDTLLCPPGISADDHAVDIVVFYDLNGCGHQQKEAKKSLTIPPESPARATLK